MGKMYILYEDNEGKVFWDESLPEEVAMAQSMFKRYIEKDYIACKIEKNGGQGVQIIEFDPKAKEIILLPIIEGG
jgi:hypothetical protein